MFCLLNFVIHKMSEIEANNRKQQCCRLMMQLWLQCQRYATTRQNNCGGGKRREQWLCLIAGNMFFGFFFFFLVWTKEDCGSLYVMCRTWDVTNLENIHFENIASTVEFIFTFGDVFLMLQQHNSQILDQ